MKRDAELPVIRACYEFVVWLVPKVGKFPRDQRFTLGEKIERQVLSVLELLIRARYRRDRVALLEEANVELEVLRYLLRIAHELRALPTKAYGDAARHIVAIGQQLGGWRKSSERRGPTVECGGSTPLSLGHHSMPPEAVGNPNQSGVEPPHSNVTGGTLARTPAC